jgi:hypothetical protein
MLNTLRALRAPESHCFLYPCIVGCKESANFPMIGIVHESPGRCLFLYLYTDCSRRSKVNVIAAVVKSQLPVEAIVPGRGVTGSGDEAL